MTSQLRYRDYHATASGPDACPSVKATETDTTGWRFVHDPPESDDFLPHAVIPHPTAKTEVVAGRPCTQYAVSLYQELDGARAKWKEIAEAHKRRGLNVADGVGTKIARIGALKPGESSPLIPCQILDGDQATTFVRKDPNVGMIEAVAELFSTELVANALTG